MLRNLLLVALGGALGSVARFLLSKVVQENAAMAFPFGTFVVNVVGCFLIGLIYGLSARSNAVGADLRLLLTTGFCGGFTTFSTLCNDGYGLFQSSHIGLGLFYTLGSLALGLAAVAAGLWVVQEV